jgi:hypothetical protein
MGARTRRDAAESLAINLFRRDHPHRLWRATRGGDEEEAATEEERSLYRSFAWAQIAEQPFSHRAPRRPGPRTSLLGSILN